MDPPTDLPARCAQLRIRDLLLLGYIDELGSLTETAARLHVTQSAVSQALRAVEDAFGAPLVVRRTRGKRGVDLTAAGAAVLMHVRVAHNELVASVRAAAAAGTPELRIGALALTLVHPLPGALALLRRRLPRVHVRLSEDTVPHLWRRLEAGEFDAIVCRLPALSESQRIPADVVFRTISHESLALVCSRRHPVARQRKPSLALLREQAWVLPPEGSYTRLEIERLFMRAGLQPPAAAITSMNFHSNLRLAASGDLLATAPRAAALSVCPMLDLVVLPVDWGREDTGITLAWREASLGNEALAALLECC
ncbi:MAG: LysR family transcriptional regulator [Proteobacteria bacterium]|nr:LysR family transcriptional regulator [Pseudomonadota bacterium]